MNCHHVQNLLSAYLDRELDCEEKRELRRHLISCPDCAREHDDLAKLKYVLENIEPAGYTFDALQSFKMRIAEEERVVFSTAPSQFYWFHRISLVATCSLLFLLTALALFPTDRPNNITAWNSSNNNISITPVSSNDQSLSIDQSVTVYQASSILP